MEKETLLFFLKVICIGVMIRDFLYFKIDNSICIAGFLGGIVYTSLGYNTISLPSAFLFAFIVLSMGFILYLVNSIGAGDVKFLAVLVFWIPLENWGAFLLKVSILGGCVGILELAFPKYLRSLRIFFIEKIKYFIKNNQILNKFLHLSFLININNYVSDTLWEKPVPYGVAIANGCLWQIL